MATKEGWLIEEYTGNPYKDRKMQWSDAGSLTAASLCTVTVGGSIESAIAIGTSSSQDIHLTSTDAQKGAGTAIFKAGGSGEEKFNYIIVHTG